MPHQAQPPVEEEGARDGSDTNSDAGDGGGGQKQSLLPASASTSESNATKPEKRAWSTQSLPENENDVTDRYHNDLTNQKIIELIAQKEALHHIEMAWRAQQRLVRRCLGLRLFGNPQLAVIPDSSADGAGKGSDTAEPDDE